MKTNLENKIKSQFENRELDVSEDAWTKLNAMLDEPVQESKKLQLNSWIPIGIAASILLIFGWIFLNQESKTEELNLKLEEKIVQQKEVQDVENKMIVVDEPQEINSKEPEKLVVQEPEILEKKLKTEKIQVPDSKVKLVANPIENQVQQTKEIHKIELPTPEVKALVAENKQVAKEKPNYVDAEMLLYSIENNKAVKQKNTESNSKLVLIDFNK